MTPAFLLYAIVVLALRLRWSLVEPAGGRRRDWPGLIGPLLVLPWFTGAERLAAAGVPAWGPLLMAAFTTLAAWLAGRWLERRGRWREGAQLAVGWAQLGFASVWLGPSGAGEFRPGVQEGIAALPEWTSLGALAAHALTTPVLLQAAGFLVATSEANLLLRWWLGRMQLKPGQRGRSTVIDVRELARGRIIGLLERALLFFFLLHGAYGAIGFTLAAKAATRFKDLDDRDFAEYVLIGTLLSSTLALAVGLAVQALAG